jgi:hypothetical protein
MKTVSISYGFFSLELSVASFCDTMTDATADKNRDFYKGLTQHKATHTRFRNSAVLRS